MSKVQTSIQGPRPGSGISDVLASSGAGYAMMAGAFLAAEFLLEGEALVRRFVKLPWT